MKESERSGGTLKSVGTTFEILERMVEMNGCGVTEIANELDLPKSTAHRYLATLVECGYVIQSDGRYHISLAFKDFVDHVYNRERIYSIAEKKVKIVAEQTGERVQFIDDEHFIGVAVHRSVGENAVQFGDSIGRRMLLHSTAAGKCILAHKSEGYVDDYIENHGLIEKTAYTITDPDELSSELEEVRQSGYAFNEHENIEGLRAVGVPILDANDDPLGAISISGPTNRLTKSTFREEYPDLLLGIANEIELTIEYSGHDERTSK